MRYADFERIMSQSRMSRYLQACNGDTRKAMTLYRKNLKLSQKLFTIISCFEIALRNTIDFHLTATLGHNWLFNAAQPGGIFDTANTDMTKQSIISALNDLGANYSHPKLVAALGFGFWRYMFGAKQFHATGQTLLAIFPNKPISTPQHPYNAKYVSRN